MDAPTLVTSHHAAIGALDAAAWNALDAQGVPFLRHEFLHALESSGSVSPATGWQPMHVAVHAAGTLVGALPLYEKTHSWGEFVFDFSWAQAYARYGERYYPKLVSATPFTPATGPRFLVHPAADTPQVRRALLDGALALMPRNASLHVQFTTAEESAWLTGEGFLPRIDCQFQWQNQGYADFDAFLGEFTADKRKKAKRERRRVQEAGIRFEWRDGADLPRDLWQAVYALKASTFHRHGHEPYLNPECFASICASMPGQPVLLLAWADSLLVATAVFFRGRDTLYGRYWGAAADFHSLHFEACYHQGIEYCIREGLERFEPGTQGEHKIARGFRPTFTHSVHRMHDPRFHEAIGRFLAEEREGVRHYAAATEQHVPYRASESAIELPPGMP